MQANPLHERTRSFCVALVIVAACMAIPQIAMAAPWDSTAQKTFELIMSVARWVAIIGVIACGAAAIFGKLSWDWAGKIIIGLVLIFGATAIVDYFKNGMGS